MSWARADFLDFLANSCSIGDEKRGNMHRPAHFAADFLQARQAARFVGTLRAMQGSFVLSQTIAENLEAKN